MITDADGRTDAWREGSVETGETTLTGQMAKVLGYIKGLHATHLIMLGTTLGLFDALAERGSATPSELARATRLHRPYVRVWCEASCALELLDYDPTRGYRFAPFMDQTLGDPAAAFSLRHFPATHLMLARDYETYPALFASGHSHPYGAHDEAFLDEVATALDVLPRMFLTAVLPDLPDLEAKLEAGAKILDVGCGAGAAIVEFAQRFPKATCVGQDIEPTSIAMAEERIARHGLGDRVSTRLIDTGAWPDDLTDGSFDLVMSYLVLHEIDPMFKVDVLRESARALAPGGYVLIFDERYPSAPAGLRDPTQIFAVMAQWYEVTWGNIVNTREEIEQMLEEARLRAVHETALSRFHIVVAAHA